VPTADRQKATVRVRIGFEKAANEALDPRILPDMGVKVSFLRDEQPASALATGTAAPAAKFEVPRAAVRSEENRSIVFVVRDGRVERRAIRTGLEQGEVVEVLSGVSTGEQVVINPPASLKDGDRIRIEG
jgi:multidrug efflux pump subunit AcrA (membrane-fusion protein)